MPAVPGHTQAGERPAIIMQDASFNAILPTTLIVPFTTTKAATRFGGTLLIQPDLQNGLSVPSVALVFQLSALDKTHVLHRLGILNTSILDQVIALLDKIMGR